MHCATVTKCIKYIWGDASCNCAAGASAHALCVRLFEQRRAAAVTQRQGPAENVCRAERARKHWHQLVAGAPKRGFSVAYIHASGRGSGYFACRAQIMLHRPHSPRKRSTSTLMVPASGIGSFRRHNIQQHIFMASNVSRFGHTRRLENTVAQRACQATPARHSGMRHGCKPQIHPNSVDFVWFQHGYSRAM